MLGTVLVLLGGAPLGLLVHPVSAYVGRLSYSLYLWHWPVLVLGAALLPAGAGRTGGRARRLRPVLSVLSLHLVEDPVRRSGWLSRRTARRRSPRTAVALIAAAAACSSPAGSCRARAAHPRPALPRRRACAAVRRPRARCASSVAPAAWPALDLPLASISRTGAPEWLVDRCDNVNPGNVDRCRYGDLTAPRTAVVVGDSMATSWLPALRAVLDPREWSVQVLTRNQCPLPRLGFWREQPAERFTACDEHKDWAFARVRALQPDLVLASNSTTMLDHQAGEPSGDARFPPWRAGHDAHARAARAVRRARRGAEPAAARGQPAVLRHAAAAVRSTARRTCPPTGATCAPPSVLRPERPAPQHVDVEALFCAAGRCPGVVGSTPVYTDGRHLTAAYARRLAPQLGRLLAVG